MNFQATTGSSVPCQERASARGTADCRLAWLEDAIGHAAHLLPAQGPISVFVHHNTLHMFEGQPFEEALREGGRTFGCQTYLPEDRYREELARGRIQIDDLTAVLEEDLHRGADVLLGFLGTRYSFRLAMLEHPLHIATDAELRWLMIETDALRRFRAEVSPAIRDRMVGKTRHWVMRDLRQGSSTTLDELQHRVMAALHDLFEHFGRSSIERWSDADWESFTLQALWRVCRQGVHGVPIPNRPDGPFSGPRRLRDLLLAATGHDSDALVHDLLIRFCGAFLDQGLASWALPDRDAGFYRSFLALYGRPGGPPEGWLSGLRGEVKRQLREGFSPLASIDDSLRQMGVPPDDQRAIIQQTLLAMRGWGGMLWQMETNAEWTNRPAPRGSLIEFLAIRLILDRHALSYIARRQLGADGRLADLRSILSPGRTVRVGPSVDQRAFILFQLSQLLGWEPEDLFRMRKREWTALLGEVEAFDQSERRRVYQLAFERRYRNQALDAIALRARSRPPASRPPRFQLVTCIDDREESFRRHLEELCPDCETFGVAGFFAAAMYYRGAADAHFIPLCPVVIKPQHYVQEEVAYNFEGDHLRRARTRRALGSASHGFHTLSRSFLGGAATALVGSLATFPLVARILFPRLTARLRRLFGGLVQPPPVTQLHLERTEATPGPTGGHLGYSIDEMAGIVSRTLHDIGLTSGFSRLVVIVGHGSSSLNNPHESAYNCGACGGGRGGPNARAFANMANDPRIRSLLARGGLSLPPDVYFIGAYHNTCDDGVTYFDLDRLPATHRRDFDDARQVIDRARERNAHERCRRFESAPLDLSPEGALRHVEERAEDLSQARPEYNHATNALCIVGRRSRSKGLFLDRRAFLASYDPTLDDASHAILARILAAVIPVCSGISLEYYFSTVDVSGFGCGSKLPHNIASLLGVMEGATSDLRTGLSAQMTEIHEPLRLLFVIETTPDAILEIIERNPTIARICRNRWVQLAVLDPDSARLQLLDDGQFVPYRPESRELPVAESSLAWYRGWRDHLGFATIRPTNPGARAASAAKGRAQ
jgi:uncharacterized protein YbcC (UPF0753/DUF2309 family)